MSNLSRRKFIVSSAGAAFILGLDISGIPIADAGEQTQPWQPNAFIKIAQDNTVTIVIKHIEFGQGTYTGLATLVAEELDANWQQVVCEHAPADVTRYANLQWGAQGTGGSSAIANSYMQMREAGAAVKAMLIAAAASKWGVPATQVSVDDGIVTHKKSGKKASFGELASLASKQNVPQKVELKSAKDFKLIGKKVARKDDGKTDGSAVFTQDIQLPNMLTALVAHPPKFGAKLVSYDDKDAKSVNGFVATVKLPNAVAVIADNFWQAKTAREKLKIKWDESAAFNKSSDELLKEYKALAQTSGDIAGQVGDIEAGFAKAKKVLEAEYAFPFLAHATMEPMNCVIQVQKDAAKKVTGAELWYGCQLPTMDQGAVAGALGLEPNKITINTVYAGGSFGRRGNSHADYVVEAALIANAYEKSVPIKLVWTREDDMQAGYYRPMYYHKLKAGLDDKGKIVAWQHRIVGQSILKGTPVAGMIQNGIDVTSVEGAVHLPYTIPNMQVELHSTEEQVPVLWWRSVGSTHTAYAIETFLDELAKAASVDPVEYRLKLLGDDPRHKGVLDLALKQSGYAPAKNRSNRRFGVALHKSFGTYIAQVVEVMKAKEGYHIKNITCAVDCGVVVNPDVVKAQMEGGIGYGLSPTLMSQITLKDGRVVESNFHDYQVVRMKDMPNVDVFIVPSAEPPTGVGEPSTPVIGPALANALMSAGEGPLRTLPMNVKFVS